ncbi:MAG: 3-hydroxybutyryl-CoA dehydrogenase, partial [Candidatus Aenigmarchaeota archaeon]|nr:3-hydroxybutyryl-CoA dehydrogenase [Candidatus Aenigmarchaeota archaeon]
EGIRGLLTSDETFQQVRELAEVLGKRFVVAKNVPGFAANGMLMPFINEAFFKLQGGVSSANDIDLIATEVFGHPMGPLKLADFIGLDTCLASIEAMHAGFGDKYRPCPLLREYVEAGRFGKKSGKGVYDYLG